MTEIAQMENSNIGREDRVLLIDLENCPNQIHRLQENLKSYHKVVIYYAHSCAKVPLDWLMPLSEVIQAEKLQIFKMPNQGKNAADFGISFHAGLLTQQLGPEVEFVIMSNDKDLDHVVDLLKSHKRSARRIGTKKEQKQPDDEPAPVPTPLKDYCKHLIKHNKTRPQKTKTLLSSIERMLGSTPEAATKTLQSLKSHGVVKVNDQKVSYDDKKIGLLAQNK